MAINTAFLVQSKDLQQYFVDKDTGLPLVAGTVELFQDESRLVHKNWYEQTGIPPNYSYTVLPNPMTLSSVGTVIDDSGNDVLPLYYPYDESSGTQPGDQQLYYIVIKDSDGEIQFTRSGFPYPAATGSSPSDNATFKNYIYNNAFWRNIQPYDASGNATSINLSSQTQYMVAPSQHDGFSQPDWQFLKGNTTATDGLIFQKFQTGTPFTGDIMPEFYINFNCTALGTNEQFKVFQVPITFHLITLQSTEVKFTIQIQGADSNPANVVKLYVYQFLGTGAPSQPAATPIDSYTCTTSWKKNETTFTTPSLAGKTLGPCGDDALYLQIAMPINSICNINFTLPSLYIGNVSPTNDFEPYDYWDAFINNYRTGDFRSSLNAFLPGWVGANDGSIGNFGSAATTRANSDTWPLYNLIWSSVLSNWAPMADGSPRGATALADFTANSGAGRAMYLTRNLGRVIQGLNPVFSMSSVFTTQVNPLTFTASTVTNSLTLGSAFTYQTGTSLQVSTTGSLPSPLVAATDYFAIFVDTTHIKVAATLADALANNPITLLSNGSPTNTITNDNNTITLATPTAKALTGGSPIQVYNSGGALPSPLVANTVYYVCSPPTPTTTAFALSTSLDNANLGIAITITSTGSGTNTVSNALGAYIGGSGTTEVPEHAHNVGVGINFLTANAGGNYGTQGASTPQVQSQSGVVTDDGINTVESVSLLQPTVNLNVFIKL